jgi:hypothetical protein
MQIASKSYHIGHISWGERTGRSVTGESAVRHKHDAGPAVRDASARTCEHRPYKPQNQFVHICWPPAFSVFIEGKRTKHDLANESTPA